jgi:hypothetical protein
MTHRFARVDKIRRVITVLIYGQKSCRSMTVSVFGRGTRNEEKEAKAKAGPTSSLSYRYVRG